MKKPFASEVQLIQLNSHDLDESIDGYERISDVIERNDDCLQRP